MYITIFSLFVHSLMDIWATYTSWLLRTMLQWTNISLRSWFQILLDIYTELGLLDDIVVFFNLSINLYRASPRGSESKVSACNAGDLGLIPGLGRSPGEGMAVHSSILAWRITWMEEPGGPQSARSQRVGHNWATSLSYRFIHIIIIIILAFSPYCFPKSTQFYTPTMSVHP